MSIEVLGISGSPIENSNTDRLIQAVLRASELEFEFVKLSQINIRPCLACKQCVPDNICKVKDDFPELAEKIKKARALIIGGYIPYKQIDGFTKALLERFWAGEVSFRMLVVCFGQWRVEDQDRHEDDYGREGQNLEI